MDETPGTEQLIDGGTEIDDATEDAGAGPAEGGREGAPAHGSSGEKFDEDAPGDAGAGDEAGRSEGEERATGDGADPNESADADEAEEQRGPGPGADLSDDQLDERVAALLFASPDPLSVGRLVSLLERPPAARVRTSLERLAARLEASALPVQLRGIKGGHTLMTVPELGEVVGRLAKGNPIERISPAALETLSIVAYRQPVTKAEIEAIRGVQAGPILRSLVDRGLVRVTGRADVPGAPLQYGTTKDFLDRFGLMSLDDLPRDAELAKD
ncbi:MAG: SMC-Scp complex subunit ScpB [Planctomycetota bacterium]